MGSWLDFLMLALALGAGWLGYVLLTLAGWRPLPAPVARARQPRRRLDPAQALDRDT
ncbi:MAG TPA: hypothetical protein PKD53_08220 [Chloroflexaceae bacterium]|nr:hypothetical protein [Chloroflexaceae bacterium]